jgi:hypothetical protein
MKDACPRCRAASRESARFCANCGLSLEPGIDGSDSPGRIRHPNPADVPAGMNPVEEAAQIYYRSESSLGGATLIGTEGLCVAIFNAGYALRHATFAVRGTGRDGRDVLSHEYAVDSLPRGGSATIEVPSYDLSEPVRVLRIALASAEFAPDHDVAAGG